MFLSCVCPTYKRPDLLSNSLACFLAQDFPKELCELVIYDDAGQFTSCKNGNVEIISVNKRHSSLYDKYNFLIEQIKGDVVVIWEDDDVYLPWHLKNIASGIVGYDAIFYRTVYRTCTCPWGQCKLVNTEGRYHASWAYTKKLFELCGGYTKEHNVFGDLQLGQRLRSLGKVTCHSVTNLPSFIMRWNDLYYHASKPKPCDFEKAWFEREELPVPWVGELKAAFDEEALLLFDFLGVK